MVDFNDLFDSEVNEFQQKAKSEEEIQKMCTKEDMTELQRAVHLLKKGYEVQKIAVINNLDRYMLEQGANEDLLSLIIGSLDDWDDNMQTQCAQAFIIPLQKDLIGEINKQRLLRLAVEIITDQTKFENDKLIDAWVDCFAHVVGKVDIDYVGQVALKPISELCESQTPLPRRKLGNRLVVATAKSVGEAGLEEEPTILRLIQGMCYDSNFKIRLDGSQFFREYIQENQEKLTGTERMENIYLPELYELLNDEESYVRMDAIEGATVILDKLDLKTIEEEFVPNLKKAFDVQNNADDLTLRLAKIIGEIVYKMSKFGLHIKYKDLILTFFKGICNHEKEECRLFAIYNLPCFHMLFKKYGHQPGSGAEQDLDDFLMNDGDEEEIQRDEDLDFQDLYNKFALEQNCEIRCMTAACIHEPFAIVGPNDDINKLQMTVHELLEDGDRDVIQALSQTINKVIPKYCNQQTIDKGLAGVNFADMASTQPSSREKRSTTPTNKKKRDNFGFMHSASLGVGGTSYQDFMADKPSKTNINKEPTKELNNKFKVQIPEKDKDEVLSYHSANYIYLPEFCSEQIYSDLLHRILTFNQNISSVIGLWREHVHFLNEFAHNVQAFHLPELQDLFASLLFDIVHKGNAQIRQAVCKVLVAILVHQHDSIRKADLIQRIIDDLYNSSSYHLRSTFIFFCSHGVKSFSRAFFTKYFYEPYLTMAADKVSQVRIQFVKALLNVKPFLEYDKKMGHELMQALDKCRDDPNQEVAETSDNIEIELLQNRKAAVQGLQELEEKMQQLEITLSERENKEIEEKKKRADEEEEKYDFSSLMDRKGGKKSTKLGGKGNRTTGAIGSGIKSGAGSRNLNTTGGLPTPTKRKQGVVKRNSNILPDLSQTSSASSKRVSKPPTGNIASSAIKDDSAQIPGGGDNYKRYQMLVQQSKKEQIAGGQGAVNGYKRTQSLREEPSSQKKLLPPKKSMNLNDQQSKSKNAKVSSKISDDDDSEGTPKNTRSTIKVSSFSKR